MPENHDKLLELILEAILQKVAEDMSPELLDKLFRLEPNDPAAHKLLQDHIQSRHQFLRGRKSQKAAPASEPSFEQMPSGRRALIGRNATQETNALFRGARKGR